MNMDRRNLNDIYRMVCNWVGIWKLRDLRIGVEKNRRSLSTEENNERHTAETQPDRKSKVFEAQKAKHKWKNTT
jgi:hypothetical protein